MQEITIHVPTLVPIVPAAKASKASGIPVITVTEPDSEPFDEDAEEEIDMEEETEEEISLPTIAVSPPSPRPKRKELPFDSHDDTFHNDINEMSTSEEPPDISVQVIPQIQIIVESPTESPQVARTKFKPPPIHIPHSNFLNFNHEDDVSGSSTTSSDTRY